MSSLLARSIGLVQEQRISAEAAMLVMQRRGMLTRVESRLVVSDFLGKDREQLAVELKVSQDTLKSYWKRIYKKTNLQGRHALRRWVEGTLCAELEANELKREL